MAGMSGVSGAGGMSANCKMQGMHGNNVKQVQTAKEDNLKQESQPQVKQTDSIRGTIFDLKL